VEACIRGDLDLVQRGVDLGYRPDSEDKWERSPLHLAAAQGRSSVVQRLLETGTDVNRANSRYGPALVTTLEGLSADKLTSKSIEDSDRSYAAELAELEDLRCPDFLYTDSSPMYWYPSGRRVPFMKPQTFRASTTEYAKTISLLLSKGACVNCLPGRFGTALTLAAFAGLDETFDLLLLHGAEINGAGGILGSTLSTAIDQGHMSIVDRLLSTAKRSENLPGPENTDLHRACEIGNLSIVGKLLELGHKPGTADSNGRTALKISLNRFRSRWEVPADDQTRLAHMLMDAGTRPILSADELVAVTEIKDSRFRSTLVDRFLASTEQHKIPEESFIHFLQNRDRDMLQRILDKKAVTSVTTGILASVDDADTLKLLLKYDPSYVVTSATIDAIQPGLAGDTREMVETLLLRSPSLRPTESQVCKILAVTDKSWDSDEEENEGVHLLDLMFSRNQDLSVTEVMLETVLNPEDLRVLLAHLLPGKHVVTDRVLKALHPPHDFVKHGAFFTFHSGSQREYIDEMLRKFLEFEPSAKVCSEVAQQFFKDGNLDTLERLLDHDSSIVVLPEKILSIVHSLSIHTPDEHRRFVEILGKHPGQYEMTEEFKATVDSHFQKHSEKHLKEMYYKFAGWR
jgi:ankyrin repeat protein